MNRLVVRQMANHLAKYICDIINSGSDSFGTYHFTDGKVMSWYDFALKIFEENEIEGKIGLQRAKNYRTIAKRPSNSALN